VIPLAGPAGVVGVDTVSEMAAKFAVTVLGPLIVNEAGLVEPVKFPVQFVKL
jgi:hypothetical protein